MKRFIDIFNENVKTFPNRIALATDTDNESITYKELDSISAKIYNYLYQKKIGKEQFVLICLPRGMKNAATIIGIIKSGAAFTVVEDTYPEERIEFIKKDCNVVLTIDDKLYNSIILDFEEKPGHEDTDRHDACYAVYTSGTTGNPKGVLHEYGKIEMCVDMKRDINAPGRALALGSPLNFVASTMVTLKRLTDGDSLYILSYDTAKNLDKYCAFMEEHNIDKAFLMPSILKVIKKLPGCIKLIEVGGEPANGLYIPNVEIINSYGSSETAFLICTFVIDKKYDKTPVGKSTNGIEILILDDEGRKLPDGQSGEICFRNEFTRGYINLPEQTKKAFVDGIYHTGDCGYKDENGNLVIDGRIDDMIKINGNRIEPAEIENVVKSTFGVQQIVAKGFSSKNRAYVALYYLNSEGGEIFGGKDAKEINERISNRLPEYMLPAIYVPLDKIPVNVNGKISRKLLEEPVFVHNEEYIAPDTDLERRICDVMANVLSLEKISVEADFFNYGGDSMSSINFVTECSDLGISGTDLYRLRTPRKIAEYVENNVCAGNIKELDREARNEVFPLLASQKFLIRECDGMLHNGITIPVLWKLNEKVDINRLKESAEKAILAHPVLLTRIQYLEDDTIGQSYDASLFAPVEICKMTENAFRETVNSVVGHFSCLQESLYKCKIFVTEEGKYFLLDLSHLIVDGTGLNLFLKDILSLYMDSSYEIKPDYYFGILKRIFDIKPKETCMDALAYYNKLYAGCDIHTNVSVDHEDSRADYDTVVRSLEIEKSKTRGNVFFVTASAMAAARYNHEKNAMIYWIHNMRDDVYENDSVGQLICPLPVILSITENDTPESLLQKTREQVEKGIQYKYFDFFETYDVDITKVLRFIYEKDIFENKAVQDLAKDVIAENCSVGHLVKETAGFLSTVIIDNPCDPKLQAGCKYAKYSIDQESGERFLDEVQKAIAYLCGEEG